LSEDELVESNRARSRGGISGQCITTGSIISDLLLKYSPSPVNYTGCFNNGDREIRIASMFRGLKITEGKLLSKLPGTVLFLPNGIPQEVHDLN
jgi:hypothetical protein